MAFAVGALVLGLHASRYTHFITDDAYISLRYSARLLEGHGLTWTDGAPVEGYSNLLMVLACAALGALGLDLEVAARLVSAAGTLAALAAAVRWCRPVAWRDLPVALVTTLMLALSGPMAIWTVGGLEQGLLVGLLAWGLVLATEAAEAHLREEAEGARHLARLAGICLALACLTRPDPPLLVAAIGVAVAVHLALEQGPGPALRRGWPLAARLIGIPAAFVLAQLAFRLGYYGDWVPNTAHAKVALTHTRLEDGLRYVEGTARWMAPLVLPALAALGLALRPGPRRSRVLVPGAVAVAWASYLALIGGDFFCGRRQMIVLAFAAALLLAELISRLVAMPQAGPRRATLLLAPPLVVAMGVAQWHDPENARALEYRWPELGRPTGALLQVAFGERTPLLAVDAAGSLPYFTGLPALDMLGLNDRYLATHHPDDFGQGMLGHELGDPDYVLERAPDLVAFCNAKGRRKPCFPAGKALVARREFQEHYRLVWLRTGGERPVRPQLWVRIEDSRIGVNRSPDRVEVPAWIFGRKGSEARIDDAGRLYVPVSGTRSPSLSRLALTPGTWKIHVEASAPIHLELAGGIATHKDLVDDGDEIQVTADQISRLTFRSVNNARVYALAFTRVH